MGQVDGFDPTGFLRSDCVVLRKYQAHDLAQLDVVEEELHVYRIWWIAHRLISIVLDKIVFSEHLDIRIIDIDANGPAKSHSNRSIAGEERPPDSFPESLVGFAEL